MPKTKVVIYQEKEGLSPLLEWLDRIPKKAQDKCIVKIELLEEHGYELRRPHCDLLEQGIYELRVKLGHVNYRILYSFEGRNIVLLSHGCTKEREVPKTEVRRAIENRNEYVRNPKAHTYSGGL